MLNCINVSVGHGFCSVVFEDENQPIHAKILDTSDGNLSNVTKIEDVLKNNRIKSVDFDISHSDKDHIGGIYALWQYCRNNDIEVTKITFSINEVSVKLNRMREQLYKELLEKEKPALKNNEEILQLNETYFERGDSPIEDENRMLELCGRIRRPIAKHLKYVIKTVYSDTSLEEAYSQYLAEPQPKSKITKREFYEETVEMLDRNFNAELKKNVDKFLNFIKPETAFYKDEINNYGYTENHVYIDLDKLKIERPDLYELYSQECKKSNIKEDNVNNRCLCTCIKNKNGSVMTYGDSLSPVTALFRKAIEEGYYSKEQFKGFLTLTPHHAHCKGANSKEDIELMDAAIQALAYDTNVEKYHSEQQVKKTKNKIIECGSVPLDLYKFGNCHSLQKENAVYIKIEKIQDKIDEVLEQKIKKFSSKFQDENLQDRLFGAFNRKKYDRCIELLKQNNLLDTEDENFLNVYCEISNKGLFSFKEGNRIQNKNLQTLLKILESCVDKSSFNKDFLKKNLDIFETFRESKYFQKEKKAENKTLIYEEPRLTIYEKLEKEEQRAVDLEKESKENREENLNRENSFEREL